jgi:hypothetical protein
VVRLFELRDDVTIGTGVGKGVCEGQDVGLEEMDVEIEVFEKVLCEDGEMLTHLYRVVEWM